MNTRIYYSMVQTGVFQVRDKEEYIDMIDSTSATAPDEVRILSVRDGSVRVIEIWNSSDSPPNPDGYAERTIQSLQQNHIIEKDKSLN